MALAYRAGGALFFITRHEKIKLGGSNIANGKAATALLLKGPAVRPIQLMNAMNGEEARMASNAQAAALTFVERLAQDLADKQLELPAFPDAVIRIQLALQADDNHVADIVRILSSEPALAARLLQLANSAEIRRADGRINDLHKAVARMGYDLVRSIAVSFAMRQLQRNDKYSQAGQAELRAAWTEAIQVAAISYVLAKHYTGLSPDEALLTGLLHVIGRLYIVMRFEDSAHLPGEHLETVVPAWHAQIAKAIAENWGLSESLAQALELQNEYDAEFSGPVKLAEVLIAAKVINHGGQDPSTIDPDAESSARTPPMLERLGIPSNDRTSTRGLGTHIEEIERIRSALAG